MVLVMDELIEKILEIEAAANAVVRDAAEEEKNLDAVIGEQIEGLRKRTEEEARKKSEELKSLEDTELKNRLREIEEKFQKSMDKLESVCTENKEKWISETVAGILGQ